MKAEHAADPNQEAEDMEVPSQERTVVEGGKCRCCEELEANHKKEKVLWKSTMSVLKDKVEELYVLEHDAQRRESEAVEREVKALKQLHDIEKELRLVRMETELEVPVPSLPPQSSATPTGAGLGPLCPVKDMDGETKTIFSLKGKNAAVEHSGIQATETTLPVPLAPQTPGRLRSQLSLSKAGGSSSKGTKSLVPQDLGETAMETLISLVPASVPNDGQAERDSISFQTGSRDAQRDCLERNVGSVDIKDIKPINKCCLQGWNGTQRVENIPLLCSNNCKTVLSLHNDSGDDKRQCPESHVKLLDGEPIDQRSPQGRTEVQCAGNISLPCHGIIEAGQLLHNRSKDFKGDCTVRDIVFLDGEPINQRFPQRLDETYCVVSTPHSCREVGKPGQCGRPQDNRKVEDTPIGWEKAGGPSFNRTLTWGQDGVTFDLWKGGSQLGQQEAVTNHADEIIHELSDDSERSVGGSRLYTSNKRQWLTLSSDSESEPEVCTSSPGKWKSSHFAKRRSVTSPNSHELKKSMVEEIGGKTTSCTLKPCNGPETSVAMPPEACGGPAAEVAISKIPASSVPIDTELLSLHTGSRDSQRESPERDLPVLIVLPSDLHSPQGQDETQCRENILLSRSETGNGSHILHKGSSDIQSDCLRRDVGFLDVGLQDQCSPRGQADTQLVENNLLSHTDTGQTGSLNEVQGIIAKLEDPPVRLEKVDIPLSVDAELLDHRSQQVRSDTPLFGDTSPFHRETGTAGQFSETQDVTGKVEDPPIRLEKVDILLPCRAVTGDHDDDRVSTGLQQEVAKLGQQDSLTPPTGDIVCQLSDDSGTTLGRRRYARRKKPRLTLPSDSESDPGLGTIPQGEGYASHCVKRRLFNGASSSSACLGEPGSNSEWKIANPGSYQRTARAGNKAEEDVIAIEARQTNMPQRLKRLKRARKVCDSPLQNEGKKQLGAEGRECGSRRLQHGLLSRREESGVQGTVDSDDYKSEGESLGGFIVNTSGGSTDGSDTASDGGTAPGAQREIFSEANKTMSDNVPISHLQKRGSTQKPSNPVHLEEGGLKAMRGQGGEPQNVNGDDEDSEESRKFVNLLNPSDGDTDEDDMGDSLSDFIVEGSEESQVDRDEGPSESGSESESNSGPPKESIFRSHVATKRKELKWEFEADMLAAMAQDSELALRGLCALYRQQTEDERQTKNSVHNNRRGFDKYHASKASWIAEFLTEGNSLGPVKKSVQELQARYPRGAKFCEKITAHHSKQLFEIYQNGEDPHFPAR